MTVTHHRAYMAELPPDVRATASTKWPFEVGLLYRADCIIDDSYQRPAQEAFVTEITDAFSPTLVGTLDVSARENGVFAVLDGQQRYLAMGNRGMRTFYASIYKGMSLADEAGFFFRKNRDRRGMPPFYAFRARTVAGDQEAIDIRDTVEQAGFVLGQNTNDREVIGAIKAVETAYGYVSDDRNECLSPGLRTIRGSWYGRKGSLDSTLITGLGRFWSRFADEEVDLDRLNSQLAISGPSGLLGMARDRYATVRGATGKASMQWLVARSTAEVYNQQLERKLRLDLKRLGVV